MNGEVLLIPLMGYLVGSTIVGYIALRSAEKKLDKKQALYESLFGKPEEEKKPKTLKEKTKKFIEEYVVGGDGRI